MMNGIFFYIACAVAVVLAALGWFITASFTPSEKDEDGNKAPAERLAFIVSYMRRHGITLAQVAEALQTVPALAAPAKRTRGDVTVSVMYFLGATFVFAGLGVYIATFWDSMSSAMRIFSTLGVGIGLSAVSIAAMKEGKFEKAVLPLILVAAMTECGGWFVFLHEMFPHGDDMRKAALFCCGMMAFQQAMVFHPFRRNSLAFTAIVFAYGALQAALDLGGMRDEHIALLLGGAMIYTAYILGRTPHRALCTLFFALGCAWFNTGVYSVVEQATNYNIAGIIAGLSVFSFGMAMRYANQLRLAALTFFIGSGIAYGGLFEEVVHTNMELLYFGIAVAMMYVSAMLQSRALLITSVLAILGFIGYYTSEHFLNSAGWPIALMLMGLAFLGIGTMAVRIKCRYNM